MTNYLVGYDLDKPDQDYKDLIEAIKAMGDWWHCLDSTWIVRSNLSASEIHSRLWQHMGSSDKLLVSALARPAAWNGFSEECSSWLKNNL